MEPIVVLSITAILICILATMLAMWLEEHSITNAPTCGHYGELKKYVHENRMWMCKDCEDKFKQLQETNPWKQ